MSLPPPDRTVRRPVVMLESPREAAERARVYRRRTRGKPRDRWLRVVALVGSLFLHLFVLIGVVLGPAYVPPPLPDHPREALVVRLIEKKKQEPPPPPPVRGTPPKERGPVHRGSAARVAVRTRATTASPALPAVPRAEPVPVPTIEPPVVDVPRRASVPTPQKVVAAPPPPVAVPTPAPTPDLQPVPLTGEPPTIALDTPPVARPVPPKFQPEPPRKPQPEGNRPMPPPPSLAMPDLPAQAPPRVAPPTMAIDRQAPTRSAPASVVVARPVTPAAPPVPDLQPVPLPAQAAPTVSLQTQLAPPTPVVATERPQVQAPALTVAEQPQLQAIPVAPRAPSLIERPSPPAPEAPRVDAPLTAIAVTVARPQAVATSAPVPVTTATTETAAKQAIAAGAPATAAASPDGAVVASGERDVSTAPDATPQGSDTATPGSPRGAAASTLQVGPDGSVALPAPGRGEGVSPGGDAGARGQGDEQGGRPGEYVQLKPHGDTQIMEHRAPNIGYKPTRFEQDWTPEGESSIDTALRHAVEKTTAKHTFHLPRGVRIECVAMPLLPMALFGCHNPDPPRKPLEPEIYTRLNLPSAPLASPATPAPARSAPAPAPIVLDNSVQCASARVSGGPLPPGCAADAAAKAVAPARASSSWVPASDQF